MKKNINRLFILIALLSLVISCSNQYGRYQQKYDSTPTRTPSQAELRDAIPRAEAPSRGGNKNYTVRGKHYQVLKSADNFKQTGIASWYGKKFHGHLTSNGEIYNMYGMSAAHKNLPLPTYVKVTNNGNGKTVIVRVNDRGPFHQQRIIDLSYSAAYKLDMLKTGTANVTIEAITNFHGKANSRLANNPTKSTQNSNSSDTNLEKGHYIQVLATKNENMAQRTALTIAMLFQQNAFSNKVSDIYRVQIGPFKSQSILASTLTSLRKNGYPNAFKIKI